MDYAIQQTLNALSFGAEYALIALGLAIVFLIMGLVNFAHGEVVAFGGYSMVITATLLTSNPWIIMVGVMFACVLTAVVLERVAFRTVRGADAGGVSGTCCPGSHQMSSASWSEGHDRW